MIVPYPHPHENEHLLFPALQRRCPFCKKVRHVSQLELYGLVGGSDAGWVFDYPAWAKHGVFGFLTHADCGPNTGYALALSELARSGWRYWDTHLHGKTWYQPVVRDYLMDALLIHAPKLYHAARAWPRYPDARRAVLADGGAA